MTGSLPLSLENVSLVLSAGDLLLLDWVVASCQQFLLTNIHTENVVTAARIASLYRCLLSSCLCYYYASCVRMEELERSAKRFCETQFCDLVR